VVTIPPTVIAEGSRLVAVRSYLYVPADRADMLEKARGRGADALIVDLEDAVAHAAKEAGRRTAAAWLEEVADWEGECWVRVNPDEDVLQDDVAAVVRPGLTGIVLPKTASPDEMEALDHLIRRAEATAGLPARSVRVVALIETATGLLEVGRIARMPRVSHLSLGEYDLAADLGMEPGPDRSELDPVRVWMVVASAAADLPPPVAPASIEFRDLEVLRASTHALRRLGFGGRTAIHPAQVPVINDVFTPSDDEVKEARALVERFEAAAAAGSGVITDEKGRMVDRAVVRAARRTLEFARLSTRAEARGEGPGRESP
jgi:citrate lyase subunit beta/citryl-CoA lyase